MRELSPEEIERLLRSAVAGYRVAVAFAIFSGCRQSEQLGLRWGDVDFERGVVSVRGQLGREGKWVALPKTERAEREIPLFDSLAKLLREHREKAFSRGYASPDDYVFATLTGAPMSHRNLLSRGLGKAQERAGFGEYVKDRRGRKKFRGELRWHDLRHVYAALAIEQGWSEEYLASVMGHASSAFTREVYGGLFDRQKRLREAREGLEAAHGATLERMLRIN